MIRNETRPETAAAQFVYREDHSGARWPLAFSFVLGWALLVVFGILMNVPHLSGLGVIAAAGGILGLITAAGLQCGRSLSIRVTEDGIQIGGTNFREQRIRKGKWPPRKPLKAPAHYHAVFSCPWEGVRSVYLITDKDEFRRFRRDLKNFQKATPAPRIPLGVFSQTWFVKARLIITHNAVDATADPAEFRKSWARYGDIEPVESPTWMIPTRNPRALRAALEQVPKAPRVQEKLPPEAVFQFRSG